MTLKKRLFWFINKTLFEEEFIEESNSTVESWYKKGYEVGYSDGKDNDNYNDDVERYFDVISYELLQCYDDEIPELTEEDIKEAFDTIGRLRERKESQSNDDCDEDEDDRLAKETFRELDEYMGYALSNDD